jgi:colanic acid biosynthesis glycosyl transferase WcaI
VPCGEIDALARALDQLIDDPALRLRLGAQARRRAIERYSMAAVRPALRQVIESHVQF